MLVELNLAKCAVLWKTNMKAVVRTPCTIRNNRIQEGTEVKYLGITATSNMKWNVHVDNVPRSALNARWFIKRKLSNYL